VAGIEQMEQRAKEKKFQTELDTKYGIVPVQPQPPKF
jgi:hypothetical protein